MHDLAIVICTINRAHFLQESLFCLKNEIWDNVEIIIVDDGSTDNTENTVNFFKRNMNIQYIKRKKTAYSSPAAARNIGWKSVDAKYISFTDPEIILKPNTVKLCYDYHISHPQTITALKPIMLTDTESETFAAFSDRYNWLFSRDISEFSHPENIQIQQRKTWRDNHFSMMPKQALIDVNGVNENFTSWGFEGIDLIERILDKSYKLYNFTKEQLFVYHLFHEVNRDMQLADQQRQQFGIKNCGKRS